MENNMSNENVAYLEFESSQARMERTNFRLWVLCIVLIVSLLGTNTAWIVYENQFEDVVTETYTAETDKGGTAIANGDGSVIYNGESELHKDKDKN